MAHVDCYNDGFNQFLTTPGGIPWAEKMSTSGDAVDDLLIGEAHWAYFTSNEIECLHPEPIVEEEKEEEVDFQLEVSSGNEYFQLDESSDEYRDLMAFIMKPIDWDVDSKPVAQARNRGTSWDSVSEDIHEQEVDVLQRTLELPAITSTISPTIISMVGKDIQECVIETKFRAKNKVSWEKSQVNEKRGSAPIFRYGHASFTHDIMTVVTSTLEKKNEHGTMAANRTIFICALLHIHGVESEKWPTNVAFPRKRQRSE